MSIRSIEANCGGGGGSKVFAFGGGGGYGTVGEPGGDINYGGHGGEMYGNEQLTTVYLGSGGGACGVAYGSNGGGAIVIKCETEIIIDKNALIVCDGQSIGTDASHNCSGCGSGGSICLKALKIVNKGVISAIGGKNKNGKKNEGSGGMGRIRIDCDKKNKRFLSLRNITPKVGYLNFV